MHSHDLLTAAADHAATYLDDPTRPPRRARGDRPRRPARRARRAAPRGPVRPARGPRCARGRRRPRAHGQPVAALLRLRLRRRASRRAGGRLARLGVGSERLPVRRRAGRGRGRAGRGRVAGRACWACPKSASFAITTGCQMAARRPAWPRPATHVLARVGWDVEARGLAGAPPVRPAGQRRPLHVTLLRAVRLLGLGTDSIAPRRHRRPGQHAAPGAARRARRPPDGPAIVCAQAGEVNSGAVDPLDEVVATRQPSTTRGSTSTAPSACGRRPRPSLRHLVARRRTRRLVGHRRAQVAERPLRLRAWPSSPTPDAHHGAPLSATAAYLPTGARATRMDWTPESSRRARARSRSGRRCAPSGREGIAEMVERCCACARRFAEVLDVQDGVEVLNDVVLNQVLVRFARRRRDDRRRGGRGAGRGHLLDGVRPRGAAGAPCGSRSPTGRRRSTTSIARARRSSTPPTRRRARSELGHSVDRVRRCTRATC